LTLIHEFEEFREERNDSDNVLCKSGEKKLVLFVLCFFGFVCWKEIFFGNVDIDMRKKKRR